MFSIDDPLAFQLGIHPALICAILCGVMVLIFFTDMCGPRMVKIGSFFGGLTIVISNLVLLVVLVLRAAQQEDLIARLFGSNSQYIGILIFPSILSVVISHRRVTGARRSDSIPQKPKKIRFGLPNVTVNNQPSEAEVPMESFMDVFRALAATMFAVPPTPIPTYVYLGLNVLFVIPYAFSKFWTITKRQLSVSEAKAVIESYRQKHPKIDMHVIAWHGSGDSRRVTLNLHEEYPFKKYREVSIDRDLAIPDYDFVVCRIDAEAEPLCDDRSDAAFHKCWADFQEEHKEADRQVRFNLTKTFAGEEKTVNRDRYFLVYTQKKYRTSGFLYFFLSYFTFCAHIYANKLFHVAFQKRIPIRYEFSILDDADFGDGKSYSALQSVSQNTSVSVDLGSTGAPSSSVSSQQYLASSAGAPLDSSIGQFPPAPSAPTYYTESQPSFGYTPTAPAASTPTFGYEPGGSSGGFGYNPDATL